MKARAGALRGLALALAVLSSAWAEGPPAEAWRSFEGTWSVSGRRETVQVERDGVAAIVEVSGAVVLTRGEGLSRGYRGQAIGFDDGQGQGLGRCVWTDANGDRIFSRLKGEALQAGKRFVGTITGGTGRYAGLEGEYSFTWEYVVAEDATAIQGRAVGLEGRVRHGGAPR
jgi:hypothetical protein